MANLKQAVLTRLGIDGTNPWLLKYQACKRKVLGTDAKLRVAYLRTNTCAKLHLGSSNHLIEGWLNTDLVASPGVMALDATAPYPFPDATFDFVFSEHMIEHVPFAAGLRMLTECHRVLKPGGIIRVVTPDLAKVLSVYPQPNNTNSEKYLQWMSNTFTPYAKENKAAHVVNAFFRLWGHQFIYDQATITALLIQTGFASVEKLELGQSNHPELRNLEHTQRYPDGLLNHESICMEARKKSAN
jgi:predicted SAM-dependent methyltransferase